MRRTIMLLAFLLPASLAAQAVIPIPRQHCVWHAGDDPRWAAADLDETGWQPYTQWKPDLANAHFWVRCRADLSPLHGTPHPAVQADLFGAQEIFLNGVFAGTAGNLRTGNFSMNTVHSFPFPAGQSPAGPSVFALRITQRGTLITSGPIRNLFVPFLSLRAGELSVLDAFRARTVLARSADYLPTAVCFGIIGVIAGMLLGLFAYDRSRIELLLLSVSALSLSLLRMNEFCVAALANYPLSICLALVTAGNLGLTVTQVPFYFALARRRVPLIFWGLLGIVVVALLPVALDFLLTTSQPVWLGPLGILFFRPLSLMVHVVLSVAPFVAFWPWRSVAPRLRPLAILCMVWGFADIVWFTVQSTGLPIPGIPDYFAHWGQTLVEVRGFATAGVLISLLALLFREQRQVTEERAELAGEMHSAQEVQRMLSPAVIEPVPGFEIQVAFRPVREVGGDFYQVLPRGEGSTLLVIGDVSGKGLKAAMTGTLAVGVLRTLAAEGLGPAALLTGLNRRMVELGQEGFITCLCVQVSAQGEVVAANAGHLPPYLLGEEIEFDFGLPVGITCDAAYTEHAFSVAEGQTLLLLSDGVVEARGIEGELFGFDRTRAISTRSAQEVAETAESFGQDDDITVLTLKFSGVPVHA